MSNKVYIYTRVSTEEQGYGYSLIDQRDQCLRHASDRGYRMPDSDMIIADRGVSARFVPLFERPGFKQIWNRIERGDRVLMLDSSRGWRSLWDMLSSWRIFDDRGVVVELVHGDYGMDTAAGRFMMHVEGAFNQLRSDLISERTREAMRRRRVLQDQDSPARAVITASRPQILSQTPWGRSFELIEQERECRQQIHRTCRLHGYVRVSSSDQHIAWQRDRVAQEMRRVAEREGLVVGEIFVDEGVSAFSVPLIERPAGKELLARVGPGDHVMAWKADRMFRSIIDMSRNLDALTSQDIVVRLISDGLRTDSPGGRRMLEMLALAAKWESEDIGIRVKAGHRKKRLMVGWDSYNVPPIWIQRLTIGGANVHVVDSHKLDDILTMHAWRTGGCPWAHIEDRIEKRGAERNMRPYLPRTGVHLSYMRQVLKRQQSPLLQGFEDLVAHYASYPQMAKSVRARKQDELRRPFSQMKTLLPKYLRDITAHARHNPDAFGDQLEDILAIEGEISAATNGAA